MTEISKKSKSKLPKQNLREEEYVGEHKLPLAEDPLGSELRQQIYGSNDYTAFQGLEVTSPQYRTIKSLDELLERDEQREKDGFKRKIHLGKVVKPGKQGSKKIIVVPTTTEDKFYHDNRVTDEEESKKESQKGESEDTGETTGTAEGEEGDIIGERPLKPEGEGEGMGAGSGEGEEHEVGASAYDLGKVLTEKFQLPNLKEKGKKKSITRYTYDLTDRNRGSGQILDKKRSLMQILKTNINLDRFHPDAPMKPENLLINPHDYVYRIMSKEKDFESQAVVFFVRDYSGSMHGRPTEIVCSQHVMIYSWLMYQYKEQVETRFILHDTEAREVKDFYSYHNLNVAGGTQIQAAFELVNKIVETENLARDYNIYIFYGGDGDDWNTDHKAFAGLFDKICTYISRLGITIVQSHYAMNRNGTEFEKFLRERKIVEKHKKLVHLDVISEDADDKRLVEGIKELVS